MFAVTESTNSFSGIQGYNYYSGDALFNGYVTRIVPVGSQTFFGFSNGKMMKVNGSAGSGHNLFAAIETSSGFDNISGYNYISGSAGFSSTITDIDYINNQTIISFYNGKIMKITGIGGTGSNMFAVTENNSGFATVPGYNYLVGCTNTNASITSFDYIDGISFIGMANSKLLKINSTGGGGYNMFAIKAGDCYSTICGYNYFLGCQNYNSLINVRKAIIPNGDVENSSLDKREVLTSQDAIVYPNPTSSKVNIQLNEQHIENLTLFNTKGQLIYELRSEHETNQIEIDLQDYPNGIYILHINTGSEILIKKIIKE